MKRFPYPFVRPHSGPRAPGLARAALWTLCVALCCALWTAPTRAEQDLQGGELPTVTETAKHSVEQENAAPAAGAEDSAGGADSRAGASATPASAIAAYESATGGETPSVSAKLTERMEASAAAVAKATQVAAKAAKFSQEAALEAKEAARAAQVAAKAAAAVAVGAAARANAEASAPSPSSGSMGRDDSGATGAATPAASEEPAAGPAKVATMPPIGQMIKTFCVDTGLRAFFFPSEGGWVNGIGRLIMIGVGVLLVYLAIAKGFEPLLLLPIGFGTILTNIPLAGMNDQAAIHLLAALSGGEVDLQFGGIIGGMLSLIYAIGIKSGAFPLIIFMGIGALTDFGPMLANPKTAFLGGAAQLGIFATLLGALMLNDFVPGLEFDLLEAASIGIIGGADGPTSIFLSSQLAPHLVGPIAVAAYSYMALVPIIQPPIMRALTTEAERKIRMEQLRPVGKLEKIVFPLVVLGLCALLIPSAAPLIGFFMFGNLMKECGVVGRLSDTAQNALLNIVTIFLGLGVGAQMTAAQFLSPKTLGILFLGVIAFSIGTAGGVLMAKLMNKLPGTKVNPLIGSAGVSAVPMAARVSHKLGMESDPGNMLLMHAMGPNVAGVIGSAVAAGVLLTLKGLGG